MRRTAHTTLLVTAALVGVVALPAPAQAINCGGKKAKIVKGAGDDKIKIKGDGHGKQVIWAGAGDDIIITGKGGDRVCGGPGDDTILPGRGSDRVYGGDGNDRVKNQKGKDLIFGELGDDDLHGGPSPDNIDGGLGNDIVGGATDRDNLSGGPGDDLLTGDDGKDKMDGGDGNDVMRGGGGGETMQGGLGDDKLYGELLDDTLDGGPGNDLLVGSHGIDDMHGGDGDDFLRGGTNRDKYFGDGGSDTASFATAMPNDEWTDPLVTVNLAGGSAVGPGGSDTLGGVENVIGSAFNDVITGDSGVNELIGGGGNDKLTGGLANDILNGGPGNDICDLGDSLLPKLCGLLGGIETPADTRPQSAYAFVDDHGQDPGLYVLGTSPGAPGGDVDALTISPAGGGYRVNGDVIAPEDGCVRESATSVLCSVSQQLSYITFYGDTGDDTLTLQGSFPLSMTADIDGGAGSDTLTGSAGADTIYSGVNGIDKLRGGDGEDALIAEGTGGDDLAGEGGNDQLVTDDVCQGHTYSGGQGYDVAGFARYDEAFNAKNPSGVKAQLGGSAVDPSRSACAATNVSSDLEILEGSRANDILIGGNGKDDIIGRGGDDVIRGGGGDDDLRGDDGSDSIFGESGRDSLDAQDGVRDKVLNCGSGGGVAIRDGNDPKPSGCGGGGGKKKKK